LTTGLGKVYVLYIDYSSTTLETFGTVKQLLSNPKHKFHAVMHTNTTKILAAETQLMLLMTSERSDFSSAIKKT